MAHLGVESALVVAKRQHAGRGQHGRAWYSDAHQLMLSALFRLERPLDGRLSLECGLHLLQCHDLASVSELNVKWANDLYSSMGKWGGILIEPVYPDQVVIGVGINVVPLAIDQIQQVEQPVTSLQQLGVEIPHRIAFIVQIYQQLCHALDWFHHDSPRLSTRFNHYAAGLGQHVTLHQGQQFVRGEFEGIQDDGALLLRVSSEQVVTSYHGRLILPI